jgi:hypothetical protein
MRRIRIMMIATTRRMWMKPPKVYEVTRPKSQRIRRITAMVTSMVISNYYSRTYRETRR